MKFLQPLFYFSFLFVAASSSAAVIEADFCIYGGTSAGVVAAVQGTKMGKKIVLVEAGQHLGGMSVEGLGGTDIDNHPFQNSPAVGGLALEFYRRVSAHYGKQAAFDAMLRKRTKASGLWRFEPHVAEGIFETWVKEAGVMVLRGHRLKEKAGVTKDGVRITALHFENGAEVQARVFMDATYEGDLLAFAGVRCVIGHEGNALYGETKNGMRTDTHHGQFDKRIDPYRVPGDASSGVIFGLQDSALGQQGAADESIQGYCFRLCLTKDAANRIAIEKPAGYDPAHYELHRRYLAAGGVISAPSSGIPNGKTDPGSWHHLAGNFTGWNHRYPIASYAEREQMLRTSRDYIQGVYWFMAHDDSVPVKLREAWAAWGLCKDEFTDNGGWPRAFYVRNGRRMVSDFVLTETHLRKANPAPIEDSVGLIWWPPDLHHARRIAKEGRVWNEGAVFDDSKEADWIPCGIPYRCLVPKTAECTNLISPTCPSSSYVAYGAYRIEFTFMVAAQSAATAAVMALERGSSVQSVSYSQLRERLLEDQQVLQIPAP
jgi:FAD dependent oxidoreductase